MKREVDARRHALDGLLERRVVCLLDKAKDVPVFSAAETVIAADLRPYMEARAPLVVEGTQALE